MGPNLHFDSELMQAWLVSIVSLAPFKGNKRHSDRMFFSPTTRRPPFAAWRAAFSCKKSSVVRPQSGPSTYDVKIKEYLKQKNLERLNDSLVDREVLHILYAVEGVSLPPS